MSISKGDTNIRIAFLFLIDKQTGSSLTTFTHLLLLHQHL